MSDLIVSFLLLLFSVSNSTPISPIYYLKVTREFAQSMFFYGDYDKAYWHLTLAQKRIRESDLLLQKGFNDLSKTQLMKAKNEQKIGQQYLNKLIDVVNTNFLQQMSSQNQNEIDKLSV